MASKVGLLWQKIRHHPFIAIGILLLIALIAFALAVYLRGWDWTGFNRYIGPELRPNQQYRPEKTLWDWLQLLIVPLVLAVGGFWLSQMQKKTEQRSTTDNQRETALQAYIDKMSELILKDHLGEQTANGELKPERGEVEEVKVFVQKVRAQKIARVRTLTVLPRLDKGRKKSVLQFLFEARLIDKDKNNIVNLSGANLSGAFLYNANLGRADLSQANLKGATGITIEELEKEAKTLQGATMPDGSKHP